MKRPDHWKHNRDCFYKYMSCDTAYGVEKSYAEVVPRIGVQRSI